MRPVARLALALLLAISASAPVGLTVDAKGPPRFPILPEDSSKAAPPLSAAGRWIVVMRKGKSVDVATGRAGRLGIKADRTFRNVVHGYSAHLRPDQVAELRGDPDVQAVVPDELISIQGQSVPTGVSRVGGKDNLQAHIDGVDGPGERVDADVAIVDTGIDKAHPDLNVAGGISCATSDPNAWGDPNGHGTHVAGIVGALDNGFGVVGVAPGVRLWAVRILDPAGNGLLSWYVCGLDWITAQRDPVDPTRPLFEAANMSVAKAGGDDHNCGLTNNDVMHQAVCRLVASGVTVVAAAGNNHFNAANLRPASYDEVITVSALSDTDGKPGGLGGNFCYSWGTYDHDDVFASFSNYGGDVDLIAPGKCIRSTLPGGLYGYMSGTSMAAPLVTGAAALYKSTRPNATPAQVRAALRAAGTLDWNVATDPDSTHEPLLDVSHIVPLGDFTVDATPGTSHGGLVGAAGGTVQLPVQLFRAEDFPGQVDLTVTAAAPLTASLDPASLAGQDQVATSMTITVPPETASGTYQLVVTASDGTRQRTSSVPVTVDGVPPVASAPVLALQSGTLFRSNAVAGIGTWSPATDAVGTVSGYEAQWRVDGGGWGGTIALGAGTRQSTRSMTIGHTYALRVRARDVAGNWSDWAEGPGFRPGISQDTSSTLVRRGIWTRFRASWMSGGTSLYSRQRGASVTRPFAGRAVALVASLGPIRGKAQIWVDGAYVGTVNLYRSVSLHRVLVYSRAWASPGRHSLRVVVLGTAGHPRVDVDAFVIVP